MKMHPSDRNAVIFDMDGCLVDSEPLCLEAIASEMCALGIADATAELVGDKFLGVSISEIANYVASRLDGKFPVQFAERVEARLQKKYPTELQIIDGVAGLLKMLRDLDIPFAIATGASSKRMAFTLEAAALAEYFDDVAFCVDDVARGKPAPDLFLYASENLGVRPSDCIVLEDSPHGIKGARAAGMTSVGFVGGTHLAGKRTSHTAILRDACAFRAHPPGDSDLIRPPVPI